ncbi:MAG: sensor domain-containing diguanylate cyclase [Usitatibacteraceae bacterium]
MQAPLIPVNERARLARLHGLNILDTPREERFDRLTRLARKMFDVPIALVSLVDANRQWFKSCDGLGVSETSREISFSGHAILGDDIFLIPDAALDARFSDNPLVTGAPEIRFYAGCPLKMADGSKLGTLCIIDTKPREFSAEDKALLRDLASMAEEELIAMQLATVDELTLISNRRGFHALAGLALGLCHRQYSPAWLLVIDLDGFKAVNDDFGHAEGDEALMAFAGVLKRTFRESDVIGRLGGDEFAVLVTNLAADGLEIALSRLRLSVAQENQSSGRGYDLAYSVGAAPFDIRGNRTITDLIAEADGRMYEHKKLQKPVRAIGPTRRPASLAAFAAQY